MKDSLATIAEKCPFCGSPLDGRVRVSFYDGEVTSLSQTKVIGAHEYTWAHSKERCWVPSLDRLSPVLYFNPPNPIHS